MSDAEQKIVATKGARLLEHFGPSFDCQRYERSHIDGYVDARRQDTIGSGKNARPIKDSTIRKELGMLYQALTIGKLAGRYAGNVEALHTDVLAPDEPGEAWLNDADYIALIPRVFKTRRDYVIVYCHTGVRYGELYRIEAKHLDHDGRRLWVLGTKGKKEYRNRWVPLSDEAYAILAARAKEHKTGELFPGKWKKPNMKLSLARACRRAGLGFAVTSNDLRRTFASWMCLRGLPEHECQKFMGHSPSSKLVRKVYVQLSPQAGKEAVAAFPKAPETLSQHVSQTGEGFGGLGDAQRTNKVVLSA